LRNYELLCILKTGFDIESSEQLISQIENSIKNFDGKIISTTKIGRKKLAYDISKTRDGFYVVFDIELAASRVADLKRALKLNESVLRGFVIVKQEAKTKVAS
jgi:small subunit ribosomal protein S6